MSGKKGWYLDLISSELGNEGERIIAKPVLSTTTIFINTLIPNSNPCDPGGDGWILGLNPFTGGRQDTDVFDYNHDGVVNASDHVSMTNADSTTRRVVGSGYSTDSLPGSPLLIGKQQAVGGSDGTATTRLVSDGLRSGRTSWKEIVGD
jgi:type IV pilus assembly protein PilY1